MRRVLTLIPLLLAITTASHGHAAPTAEPLPDLVNRALASELRAAQDGSHPMRYQLRKWSPRLSTTKDLIETRDGTIAMLLSVNDAPLSANDERKERARLDGLLADPGKQKHRKQQQQDDTVRALKVLRVLPRAFLYQDAGVIASGSGNVERFVFRPNPAFSPPDLETQVLTAMTGEIWIDPVQVRVVRLQAQLQQDVDFGWGVLGRLYKGGWITIDQTDVGNGVWRIVKFQMSMNARVLIRVRSFQTTEEESQFVPVPPGIDYRRGIAMLRGGAEVSAPQPGR